MLWPLPSCGQNQHGTGITVSISLVVLSEAGPEQMHRQHSEGQPQRTSQSDGKSNGECEATAGGLRRKGLCGFLTVADLHWGGDGRLDRPCGLGLWGV